MASAAAVAANEANSPMRNDLGEDEGHPGEITSGIYGADEELPDADEDDEDELPAHPLRGRKISSKNHGNADGEGGEDPLDLFGDDEDEADEPG